MRNATVKFLEGRLKDQALGARLLAKEMSEEVATVRHAVNSPGPDRSTTADAVAALARLDELLEHLLK